MAIYRTVSMKFWTDPKVVDDFTPEDRYFYLYLFTNPHTNLAGCYEISMKNVVTETGYSTETVQLLFERFENTYKVIKYSHETREILLLNWHKYNWTESEKFRKPLLNEIENIKEEEFQSYLMAIFNKEEVSKIYGIDTKCIDTECIDTSVTVSVTDTDTVTDTVSKTPSKKELKNEFDYLWKMYPKKQGKEKAFGYYERARKNGTEFTEVDVGIRAYIEYIRANEIDMQYVKQGATFFSQKAWNDDWTIRNTNKSANPFMDMLRTGDY